MFLTVGDLRSKKKYAFHLILFPCSWLWDQGGPHWCLISTVDPVVDPCSNIVMADYCEVDPVCHKIQQLDHQRAWLGGKSYWVQVGQRGHVRYIDLEVGHGRPCWWWLMLGLNQWGPLSSPSISLSLKHIGPVLWRRWVSNYWWSRFQIV